MVIDIASVIVKPEVARQQEEADQAAGVVTPPGGGGGPEKVEPGVEPGKQVGEPGPKPPVLPKRFFGSVEINPDRLGKKAGRIAEQVLQHLTTIKGAEVKVTLEIVANIPSGVAENTQRVVSENCQTLKFDRQGFEKS